MNYQDLRDFIGQLEQRGELRRISVEVDPYLEITEICDLTLSRTAPIGSLCSARSAAVSTRAAAAIAR